MKRPEWERQPPASTGQPASPFADEAMSDSAADTDVEEAWQVEIDRREAEVERGEVQLIPGDEVFERLRRRLG